MREADGIRRLNGQLQARILPTAHEALRHEAVGVGMLGYKVCWSPRTLLM